MTYQNDPRLPPDPVVPIKDKVVVRDDSGRSGATMLGALVAALIIGGVIFYAMSGDREVASTTVPPATTGQGVPAPAPAPVPERAPTPAPQAQ